MKNLILLMMLAIAMAAQGAIQPAWTKQGNLTDIGTTSRFINHEANSGMRTFRHEYSPMSQATRTGDEFNVMIKTEGFDRIIGIWAIPSDANDTSIKYIGEMDNNGKYILKIPKDVYDIIVISQKNAEIILLTYDKLSVDKSTILKASIDDATITTNIVPLSPDGTVICSRNNVEQGNLIQGEQDLCILWKGRGVWNYEFGINALWDIYTVLHTNQISENFSFTRVDFYEWTGGKTGMILPIDFTEPEISPSLSNWQSVELDICETPLNIRKKDVLNYTTGYQIELNSKNRDLWSFITFYGDITYTNLRSNDSKYDIWIPEDYDNEFDLWIYPSGSYFTESFMHPPCITGMPLKRGEKGLVQLGINPLDMNYVCTIDGFQLDGNPRYSGDIRYEVLGNCAPILTTLLRVASSSFDITYTGRYGENMQIDATGYPEWFHNWTATQREKLGLPVCDMAVDVDGEEICNSIDNWWDEWSYTGVFDAEISTDNILIDGEISGLSTAKIHYDSNEGNGTAPTLMALQFRNNEDHVTDRLISPTDGYLEFFAMAPIEKEWHQGNEWGTYFETGELASVKAEWSPMGEDDWTEMDVKEIPELFYMPGFGYCFRGSLEGVNKPSDNKWYDLRVRIEDEFGAYQEQTISPAFRIESVEQVSVESMASASTVSVYTIDGMPVISNATESQVKALPSGLYIVRKGNKVSKTLIP